MLLLLEPDANLKEVEAELRRRGANATLFADGVRRALLVDPRVPSGGIAGVAAVLDAPSPHPLADRAPRVVRIGDVEIGGERPVLIAGPCAVEDEEQINEVAAAVARAGGRILRGGAWKPRTSPYAFQGLGVRGLELLREAASRHGLLAVTEVLDGAGVAAAREHADILQIGSRTMQAFALLRAVGRAQRPVLLKRGMAATIEEWLLAAEHLLEAGASSVILCERGIRTFPQPFRNTLDLAAVAHLVVRGRMPVIVDPSHASGRRDLVLPLARAALAAGAHGVMVEVHGDPGRARSDGAQAIGFRELEEIGRSFRNEEGMAERPGRGTSTRAMLRSSPS